MHIDDVHTYFRKNQISIPTAKIKFNATKTHFVLSWEDKGKTWMIEKYVKPETPDEIVLYMLLAGVKLFLSVHNE